MGLDLLRPLGPGVGVCTTGINGEPRPGPLAIRLVSCEMPVPTRATNMGTSVAMIERHDSDLTPRIAARGSE